MTILLSLLFKSVGSQFKISYFFCLILLMSFSQHASAAISKCFLQAETYYEQIYCKIKEKGKGKALPAFVDFKKNNEITQALLLKRDAAALNIFIKIPKRSTSKKDITSRTTKNKLNIAPNIQQLLNSKTSSTTNLLESQSLTTSSNSSACSFSGDMITCNALNFHLIGNKKNSALKRGVLNLQNKIGLMPFMSKKTQQSKIDRYLYKSYVIYIEKMIEIGLGGVTMSFTKFAYLFNDLLEKNVDFASRFETMYSFLKKDKQQLAVSEKITPANHLTIADCFKLTNRIYICDNRTRNYVYVK
jgi:hypothetical protein